MDIFTTFENLDDRIGKPITAHFLSDAAGNSHYNVRCVIARKATKEEYMNQEDISVKTPRNHFYQLLMD